LTVSVIRRNPETRQLLILSYLPKPPPNDWPNHEYITDGLIAAFGPFVARSAPRRAGQGGWSKPSFLAKKYNDDEDWNGDCNTDDRGMFKKVYVVLQSWVLHGVHAEI